MKTYDYLIVGAGLFGAVFAQEAKKAGRKCLVIDKRNHIAGNIYTREMEGIQVHEYGAHIFHTSNKEVWQYVGQFVEFNRYTNSPIANYKGEIYNMPFNMNTFNKLWGVVTPKEAQDKIAQQKQTYFVENPKNLEEQAINLVGPDVYTKLVKGYTEKQWGKRADELPSFIIKRLPVRFTYDNNYFDDQYQGIPIGGYTKMVEKLLEGTEVRLNQNFLDKRQQYQELADTIVYTGMVDEVPYTRIIEHKHFEYGTQPKTVITREYPQAWKKGDEPYYPVNDHKNTALFAKYQQLAEREENVIFGGRLGQYKYYDMDDTVEAAILCAQKEINK